MPRLRRSVKAVVNTGLGSTTKKNKHVKRTKKNRRNKDKLVGGGLDDLKRLCNGQSQQARVITKKFIADIIDRQNGDFLIEPGQFPNGEFGGSEYMMHYPTGTFRLFDYYIIHNGNYYFIEKDDYDPTVPGYLIRPPITAASAPASAPANVTAKIQKDVDKRGFDVYILALKDSISSPYKGLFKLETICDGGAFSITDVPTPINRHAIIDIDGTKKSFSGSLLDTNPTGASANAAATAAAPVAAAAAAAPAPPAAVVPPAAAAARRVRTPAVSNPRQNIAAEIDLTVTQILDKFTKQRESVPIQNKAQIVKELKRTYTDNGNILKSTEFDDDFKIGKLKNSDKILCYIEGMEELFELRAYTTVGNNINTYILAKLPQHAHNTGFDTAVYQIPVVGGPIDTPFAGAIAANSGDEVLNIPITDDGNGGLLYNIVQFDPAGTVSAVKTNVDAYTVIAP